MPGRPGSIDLRRLCAQAGDELRLRRDHRPGPLKRGRSLQLAGTPPCALDRDSALIVGAVTAPLPRRRCGGRRQEATGLWPDIGPSKPWKPFLAGVRPRIPAPRRWRVWGEGRPGWRWPLALTQPLRARGGSLAMRAAPTGLSSWAQRGANDCGERLLAAAGASASESREPEEPSGCLTGQTRARPGAAAGLATACRPAAACGRIQPAGGGPKPGRFFASGRLRPDPNRHRARPAGVGGALPPVAGDQSAPQLAPGFGNASAPLASSGKALAAARAPALEIRTGHKAAITQGRSRSWGHLARGPSLWLWRWKAQPHRSGFMDGFEDVAAMGRPGQSLSAMPAEAVRPKLPAVAPLACPWARWPAWRGQSRRDRKPPQIRRRRGESSRRSRMAPAAAEPRFGFPARWTIWLNGRPPLHALLDLWACGGRVEKCPGPICEPLLTSGRPAPGRPALRLKTALYR